MANYYYISHRKYKLSIFGDWVKSKAIRHNGEYVCAHSKPERSRVSYLVYESKQNKSYKLQPRLTRQLHFVNGECAFGRWNGEWWHSRQLYLADKISGCFFLSPVILIVSCLGHSSKKKNKTECSIRNKRTIRDSNLKKGKYSEPCATPFR